MLSQRIQLLKFKKCIMVLGIALLLANCGGGSPQDSDLLSLSEMPASESLTIMRDLGPAVIAVEDGVNASIENISFNTSSASLVTRFLQTTHPQIFKTQASSLALANRSLYLAASTTIPTGTFDIDSTYECETSGNIVATGDFTIARSGSNIEMVISVLLDFNNCVQNVEITNNDAPDETVCTQSISLNGTVDYTASPNYTSAGVFIDGNANVVANNLQVTTSSGAHTFGLNLDAVIDSSSQETDTGSLTLDGQSYDYTDAEDLSNQIEAEQICDL